jgi:hypothetical protein
MLSRACLIALVGFWAPAAMAQATGKCPEPEPKSPFPRGLSASLQIAPEFVQNRPFREVDFADSDQTAVTLAATFKRCVTPDFGIKLTGGPSVTLDDDRDSSSGSKLSASAELRWFAGFGPLVPLIAVGTTGRYEDVFGKKKGDEQYIEAGASLGDDGWDFWSISDRRKLNLDGRVTWRWVDADRAIKGDYDMPSADFTVALPVFPKKVVLSLEGGYTYRRYHDVDLIAGRKRRVKELSVFGGVDVGGIIRAWFPMVKRASVGVTWSNSWSNIDEDEHTLKLQPVLKAGVPF